jgi:hypothetical protein
MSCGNFRKTLNGFFLALLALSAICCGGSKKKDDESLRKVSGKITYQRLPILTDDSGYPQGLGTADDAETLPLRGILVRTVTLMKETDHNNLPVDVWFASPWGITDGGGNYEVDLPIDPALPAFVEIQSAFKDGLSFIRILADQYGINSPTHVFDRELYFFRRGLDGSAPPNDPTPAVVADGNVTLNIEIGLEDAWWICHPDVRVTHEAVLEPIASGSKIAAIIDTAYKAAVTFGNPTPGFDLDLHYRQGITEELGTYVEFDLGRFPLAYDPGGSSGSSLRLFGSVRGGQADDDAWDEGILLSMMARNSMRYHGIPDGFHFPAKQFPGFDPRNQGLQKNLQPTMALAEGLPYAMAALALQTPYLTSSSGTVVRDVRIVPGGLPSDIYSGPAIASFAWALALKANDIKPADDPEEWKKIPPISINRFFALRFEMTGDDEPTIADLPSLFSQLAALSNPRGIGEPVDLADIFTDEAITEISAPFFGDIWPRPSTGPYSCFISDWGTDPDSKKNILDSFNFSMSHAVPDAEGNYSNLTFQENFTSKIAITKDTAYWLSITHEPPLAGGASLEMRINGDPYSRYFFDSSSIDPQRIVLLGNPDKPVSYLLSFSLKSQKAIVPDTQITVSLEPAY